MFYKFGHFCLFFTTFIAQTRATRQGQRKGKNVPIGDAPPVPISSGSASIASIGSGTTTIASNVQRKQTQGSKYPLWKYVTREAGPGSKAKGGGNVAWKCNFCHSHFMNTYYRVKAHLLALPRCGMSLAKRKEVEREFPFKTSSGGQAAKRKATALGPMDKIFQKEKREDLDLTIAFFFLSELHIL